MNLIGAATVSRMKPVMRRQHALRVAHPSMGRDLWGLLEGAGLRLLDRVEELSVWRRFDTLNVLIDVPAAIQRVVLQDASTRPRPANGWCANANVTSAEPPTRRSPR